MGNTSTTKSGGSSKVDVRGGGESKVMNVTVERPGPLQNHPKPYEVTCQYEVPVEADASCEITFVAVIDTGSPISLLKCELIPNNVNVIKPLEKNCNFSGINNTKLEILGIFESKISINDNILFMRFYVVPENTMIMSAILGRDFIVKPGVNVCFRNGTVNFDFTNNNEICGNEFNQILCINYKHEYENVKEILNINPQLSPNVKIELNDLFQNEYMNKEFNSVANENSDLKMKIVLKHDQPISYRPR